MSSSADSKVPVRASHTFFWLWLGGSSASALGTQILGFAIAWVASGYGGIFAGLVLTAINLPRTLLLILGGVLVDRWGSLRIMLLSAIAMLVIAAGFAISLLVWESTQWQLILVSLLIGTVDAFYLPAAGSMPRRLVPDHRLPHAMSARQMSAQLSSIFGAPLGAAVLTGMGLAAAALIDSVAFALMLVALLIIRFKAPRQPLYSSTQDAGPPQALWRKAMAGFRVCLGDSVLRPGLFMLIGTAAFILPVMSLLLPLFAQERNWSAQLTGWVLGASATGAILVAVWVMLTGGSSFPGLAGCMGLFSTATGICILVQNSSHLFSILGALIYGIGLGIFTTHVGPLLLGAAPLDHLGRVQAVLSLAQALPLLLSNLLLGTMAQSGSASHAFMFCAVAIAAISLLALRSSALRAARKITASSGA